MSIEVKEAVAGEHRVDLPPFTVRATYSAQAVGQVEPWWLSDYGMKVDEPSKNTICAVLDTGYDKIHAERGDLNGAVIHAKDFTNSPTGYWDVFGHGSATSGIIGAKDNTIGLRGISQAKLCIGKCLGDDGGGSDTSVAEAIRWAIGLGVDVINCSLGSSVPSPVIAAAVAEAAKAGILVVCAAGNDGASQVSDPADLEQTIAVGAIDREFNLAPFSNRGKQVQCVAPGVKVMVLFKNGGYAEMDGTSFSAPWVSGLLCCAAGRFKAVGRKMTVTDVRSLFAANCRDLGPPGVDVSFGWGFPEPVKFLAAVDALLLAPPVAAPVVPPGSPQLPSAVIRAGSPVELVTVGGRVGIFIPAG